ncbi:MAG: hypothetical protein A2052_04030 [Deltaproteobacteria bacterium GWA2_54_12]|nr:MAG: hypothetical protein A2052_04030 [Deltaproteobacteria bacterium GWA2_54_12]
MGISRFKKFIVPVVALAVGLAIGLGVGNANVKKEQKAFEVKLKDANRKMASVKRKMSEEKSETAALMEQQCQAELEKLEGEKMAAHGQLLKARELAKTLGVKVKEAEETTARGKKESDEALARARKALQELEAASNELDNKLKKTSSEKQYLHAELAKTVKNLDKSVADNARLCVIAEELVKKYNDKGFGTVIMEKEPLTKFKRVELEQFVKKYREEIDSLKIKKSAGER